MHLRKAPFPIDFAGNNPTFKIHASPLDVEGRKYTHAFIVRRLPVGTLTLRTPYFVLSWGVTSGKATQQYALFTTGTPTAINGQMVEKIANNHTVREHYNVETTMDADGCVVKFTDKECGEYDDQIALTMLTAAQGTPPATPDVSTLSVENGIDNVPIDSFSVWSQFVINKGGADVYTPELTFTPSGATATVSTEIVRPYFNDPDVPAYNEYFGAYGCKNAAMRVRLMFAERRGHSIGLLHSSNDILLVNGKLDTYAHRNNLPDWKARTDGKFYQNNNVDIYGQDTAETVRTQPDMEQFLYLSQPHPNTNVTARIIVNKNGEEETYTRTLNQVDDYIIRVPVGLRALGIEHPDMVTSYTVRLSEQGGPQIARSFTISPKPYGGHTLMLLNKMGVFETFFVDSITKETTTDGEEAVLNGARLYALTGTGVVLTARTGWKTATEMRILEAAAESPFNMLLHGKYGYALSMVPNTYTVLNEADDLIEAEVQFVITDRINRDAPVFSTIDNNVDLSETLIR